MVVAYDGTDFSGFAASPASRACAPSAACSAQAIGKVLRHDVRAHVRGPHRRGRARVGSGRELRVGARARPVAAAVGGQLDARSGGSRAVVRARRSRLRRAPRRAVAALPLHDPQSAGARSVPRSLRRGGCPSRSTCARCGWRPIRSSASTTSRRSAARARRARRLTRRVLESRWVDEGDGVLRYEIRANAFCWQMVRAIVGTLVEVGIGQAPARRDDGGPARRRPRRGGAARPAARACASGKSATSRSTVAGTPGS